MARLVKCKNRLPEFHEDVLMLFDNGSEMNMSIGFLCDMDEYITLWCAYTIADGIRIAMIRRCIGCRCQSCQGGVLDDAKES